MATAEVVVVGGGLVGLTAALLLAEGGIPVTVLDPVTLLPARDSPYDLRTFALTPASQRIFDRVQVWSALEAERIAQFSAMEVWDAEQPRALHFAAPPTASNTLGYVIEQANLFMAMNARLQRSPLITGIAGQVSSVTPIPGACVLGLADGREVRASVVLGCDGGASPLRDLCGIACSEHDYQQTAIVANVTTTIPHGAVARQRFLDTGPLAFLPLPPGDLSAVVWTTTDAHATWARDCTEAEFCADLTRAFDARLGTVLTSSRRVVFPLWRRHAAQYCQDRVALLGDAAHVIHPLAGQGLNLGLLDAAALAEILIAADRAAREHPQSLLRRYARWRRGENLAMLTVTEQLNRLFGTQQPVISKLRGVGLALTERLPVVKHLLAAYAMGERGEAPASARRRLG